ncbi:MAG: sensor histidine kinase [Ardenticatenaceae bacterium]
MSSESEKNLAARRILAVTEEELQRIVLDIHDGPVQQMFAAQSQITLVRNRRKRGETIGADEYERLLERVSGLLGEALNEIRGFLGTFRPLDFPKRNLVDIIQGLILQHEIFTECQVSFTSNRRDLPTSFAVKIALYRICQEALSNAYRHSGVKEQQIRLDREGDMMVLQISDQGRGFEPPPLSGPYATEKAEHIGLRGMRDRIGLVGGEFELQSAPRQGRVLL